MAGTARPRNLEEWQHWVERNIAEGRRGPIALVTDLSTRVEEQEQVRVRVPAAPVEITYQTAMYQAITAGWNRDWTYRAVRLILDFPDVTKATDGTDIAVERYELWGRNETPGVLAKTTSAVPGKAYPGMTAPSLVKTFEAVEAEAANAPQWVLLGTSTDSAFRAEDFVPGTTWRIRVRAIGEGTIQPGRWSSEYIVQMQEDNDPPTQPTAPVVTSKRGQLVVTYDGQSVSGPMPADLSYVILAQGSESSPTTEVFRFGREGGTYVATGAAYYDTQFFRLQAVDEAGNKSAWSEQGFGYPEPLVDTDVILSELDAAKTHLINVNAGVSILPDTIITEHLRVTEDMTAALAKFLVVKAGQIDVNDLWADTAFFGLADALLVRSDMFIGKAFEGGTFTLKQGGKFQTDAEALKGVKVTSTGIQAWNPSGTLTFDLSSTTGNMVATGTFYTDLVGSRVRIGDRENIAAFDAWADDTTNHVALFEEYRVDLNQHRGVVAHFDTDTTWDAFLIMTGDNIRLESVDRGWFYVTNTEARTTHKSTTGNSTMYVRGGASNAEWCVILESGEQILMNNSQFNVRTGGANGPFAQALSTFGWTFELGSTLSGTANEHLIFSQSQFWYRGANANELTLLATGNWYIGPSVTVGGFGRGRIFGGQDQIQFYPTGSGGSASPYSWMWMRHELPTQLVGGLNVFGNFNVANGTKNFVMPHPTKIGRELVHAATESPWSGIEYWGSDEIGDDSFCIVELPEYFEAIAAQDQRLLMVSSPTGEPLSWTQIYDGQFMVEGGPGTPFGWQVKARREGYDIEVEPWVDGLRNTGEPAHPAPTLEGPETPAHAEVVEGTVVDEQPETGSPSYGSGPAKGNRNPRKADSGGSSFVRHARGGN